METLEKAVGVRLIWTGGLTTLDLSGGTQNSMLPKVTMPDSFGKWTGIPSSVFQLESEPRSPLSPTEASVIFCQA